MADVAVIAVAILLTSVVAVGIYGWSVNATVRYAGVGLVSLVVWPFLFMRQRMYAARFVTRLFDEIRRASSAVALGTIALVAGGLDARRIRVPWLDRDVRRAGHDVPHPRAIRCQVVLPQAAEVRQAPSAGS